MIPKFPQIQTHEKINKTEVDFYIHQDNWFICIGIFYLIIYYKYIPFKE